MSQISEKSYGARLLSYQSLVQILPQIGYVEARPEDSVAEMTTLCNAAAAANNTVAATTQAYNTSNKARAAIFRTNTDSIIKLLPVIRKFVDAVYGKTSNDAKQIATIIEKMRSKPATIIPATIMSAERTISNSELSYGSMTQNFSDLITNLSNLPNYNPAIPNIKIAALEARLTQIIALNTDVTNSLTTLRLARGERNTVFPILYERSLRIKSLIVATFGSKSAEYKAIKGLKF